MGGVRGLVSWGFLIVAIISASQAQHAWAQSLGVQRLEEKSVRFPYLYTHGGRGGVGEVTMFVRNGEGDVVHVGISEGTPFGVGNLWRVAAWTAVTLVALRGYDLALKEIIFRVSGRIEGPSAGAMMVIALLAVLDGANLREKVVMTGTINPDGTIGPIGGIREKVLAAQAVGFKEVLIPKAQDSKEIRKELSVYVRPVETIDEAYQILTRRQLGASAPQLNPLDAESEELFWNLTRRRVAQAKRLAGKVEEASGQGSEKRSEGWRSTAHTGLALIRQAETALGSGQRSAAYELAIRSIQYLYATLRQSVQQKPFEDMVDQIIQEERERSLQRARMGEFHRVVESIYLTSVMDVAILAAVRAALANYFSFLVLQQKRDPQDGPLLEGRAVSWGLRAFDLKDLWDARRRMQATSKPFSKDKIARLFNLLLQSESANREFLYFLARRERVAKPSGAEAPITVNEALEDREFQVSSILADKVTSELEFSSPVGDFLRLGIAAQLYLSTSLLVTKYYSLAAAGSSAELERQLGSIVDYGYRSAEDLVATVQEKGHDDSLSYLFYQIGRELQHGSMYDKFAAAEHFWAASLYARIILHLAQ